MSTGFWKKIRAMVSVAASIVIAPMAAGAEKTVESVAEESAWSEVAESRSTYYRQAFGDLPPRNRLRLVNLLGIWDDSALYSIEATRLGKDVWAYSTFGLSNADMPARVGISDPDAVLDDLGRVTGSGATQPRHPREPAQAREGAAGYGYELMVLARQDAAWPLHVLHWAVSAEVFHDIGLLARVESAHALTVRDVSIGPGPQDTVCLLIARPLPPLPAGTQLPNGRMQILVATVITREEMAWSLRHGAPALLARLVRAGIGQYSERNRPSVLI
jgi:hypothetical protein